MENEKEKEEKNKQILSNALKALRECKDIRELSNDHTEALYNASAKDLYKAYLDIDTYFNADKCFSIENPCCAYGLCAGGILTTATLWATLLPCVYNSIPTTPPGTPFGTAYFRGLLGVAGLVTTAPAIGGVLALCKHKHRAKIKEQEINQIVNVTEHNNDGEQKNIFLKKLKEIISFHSYNDEEKSNINSAIAKLYQRFNPVSLNYEHSPQPLNNTNADIGGHKYKKPTSNNAMNHID